jgi:alginate export protein
MMNSALITRGLVLIGALVAGPLSAQSVATEANKELPDWLRVGGLYRARFEGFLDRNFTDGKNDVHFLNRLRIDLTVRATRWMRFVLEGQDARIFFNHNVPNAPPFANPMDLRLGYLQLGKSDQSPVSLRAGRQDLNFGEQRLLGNFNWINVGRSFDAVRMTLRHNRYRLDAFASSVVIPTNTGFDRPQTGNNLHGLYGGIEKLPLGATIEPYILWRLAPRQVSESGITGNLDSKTIGLRGTGRISAIDYGTEMVGQLGSLGPDRVRAWAGHWIAGYTISTMSWRPRFSAEYNYASGDRDPHDGMQGTFDVLYPSPHDQYGLCDQVGWRNIHDLRLGWDAKPARTLGLLTNYHNWWLVSARDALYAPTGAAVVRRLDGSAGRHVGQEIDVETSYTVTGQIQVAAGLGHIFPGLFLKKTTPGAAYTFPFVMLNYTF